MLSDIPIAQTMELRRRVASPMIQHPTASHMSKDPHAFDLPYPTKIAQIKEPSKTMSVVSKRLGLRFFYSIICSLTRKISGDWKSFVSYPTRPSSRITGGKRIGGSFEGRSFLERSLENLRRHRSSGTVSR